MNYIDIRCTNPQCDFYESKIKLSEGTPLFNCPLCGSEMEPAGSAIKADDSTGSEHWLTEIAEDPELWIPDAEEAYPSVIAYEYRKLRRYCREMKPYAVLLCLEDNFEVLLKLEVLLAYAWAAWNTDNAFEVSAASLLTAPGLSPKAWIKLASLVVKELRKAGKQLPGSIPLEQLIRLYTRGDIGNRSAVQIGQGAMKLLRDLKANEEDDSEAFNLKTNEDDASKAADLKMNEEDDSEAADLKTNEEKYSKIIRENVALLKAVYEAVDLQLRTQELYLKKEADTEEIYLTGADKACGLASSGKIYLRTGDIKSEICVYPFIVIGKPSDNGHCVLLFHNQRTKTRTHYMSYADGSCAAERIRYFERLRDLLDRLEAQNDPRGAGRTAVRSTDPAGWEKELLQKNSGNVTPEHMLTEAGGSADKSSPISEYLRILCERYGEKGSRRLRELLAVLCTLGMYEPLTTDTLRAVLKEGRAVSCLAGMLMDLSPILRAEQDKAGKLCLSVKSEFAEEIIRQIPETEETVRWTVKLTMSVLRDETLDRDPGMKAAAAHVVDLADQRLLEGIGALDKDAEDVLWKVISLEEHKTGNAREIERIPDYYQQLCDYERLAVGEEDPKTLMAQNNYAAALCGLGRYEDALKIQREVYEKRKKALGEENADTLRVQSNLAYTLDQLGRHEEALQVLRTVYELRRKALGVEDPETVMTQIMLAGMLFNLEQYKEALKHQKEVYEKRKRLLGAEAPETLTAQENLAVILGKLGRFNEELTVLLKLYAGRKKALGDRNPETLLAQYGVAHTFLKLGRYEEALKILPKVYLLQKVILGEKDPDTLASQSDLAEALFKSGRYEEALRTWNEVCEKMRKTLGEEHPDTLTALNGLADTLSRLNRHKEALQIKKEVYEKRSKVLGQEDPDTLTTQMSLACTLTDLGQNIDALPIKRDVYKKRCKVLGEEHPDTLAAQSSLAESLSNLRRHKEALQIKKEVYEKSRKVLGEDHPYTLETQNSMALTLSKLGCGEEAQQVFRDVYEKRKRVLGEEHPDTLAAQSSLASELNDLGRCEEALKLQREVYVKRNRQLGAEAPETIAAQENLAAILEKLGRFHEELSVVLKLYVGKRKALGERDRETLRAQYSVAHVILKLGRYEEALKRYRNVYRIQKQVLGEDDPDTLATQNDLADAMIGAEKYGEALLIQINVYEKRRKTLGENNSQTLSTLNNVAWTLDKLRKYREAIEKQRQLIRAYLQKDRDSGMRMNVRTIEAVFRLAEYYRHAGETTEALKTIIWADSLIDEKGPGAGELKKKVDRMLTK